MAAHNTPKNPRDGSLGHYDSEHLQLPMDPGRAPKRVCVRHLEYQATYFGCDRRSAATGCLALGQLSPEPAEALALPAYDRIRLHDKQNGSPPTPEFGQRTPEETIEGGQFRSDTIPLISGKLKS